MLFSLNTDEGITQETTITMAKAKTKDPSRSQAIRDFMRTNAGATVPQIVDGLKSGGVTVTRGLVYQVQAAGRRKRGAKRAKKKATAARAAARMANAAASTNGTGTKADQIRDVAKDMAKPVRPMDVRAALAARGIEVSFAQVGQVLKSMGMRKRRRRKAAAGSSASSANSIPISIDDLVAAKKLVAQVGSIEKVKEALSALARLS
jgi:arginine repressor